VPRSDREQRIGARIRAARAAGRLAGRAARIAGGKGTVMPGATALRLAPSVLEVLIRDRVTCLVSGTNGKTTTTALIAAAMGPTTITNRDGANLPTGWVTALLDAPRDAPTVLEVDEAYLPHALSLAPAAVVVLLNLTRDQLDRHNETRMLAQRWRDVLELAPTARVIANCDDPLVVYAAASASTVTWVAVGARWHDDATTCPQCGALLDRATDDWWCNNCALRRPEPAQQPGRDRLALALPGRANRANAAMALGAAEALGVDTQVALDAMARLTSVSGRYARHEYAGHEVMVLLAKNPAGWIETLDVIDDVLGEGPGTVVVAINAQGPDGRDPSWLWDVPFEQLARRNVIATGERATDLAVRLDNAAVRYRKDPRAPLVAVTGAHDDPVIIAATYSNFLSVSRELAKRV
jgi:UDP-N-acetylmuramyl tripeptide synthase